MIEYIIPIAHAAEEATSSGSPVAVLGLNLQLFIAQLINFAIVLFILWKFVFGPVAKKLQERTEKVEKAMKDAAGTEKEKQEFADWKNEEMSKTRQEASTIITKAQSDAGKAKDEIMHAAKVEQEKMVEAAKKQIEEQKNTTMQSAKAELADMVTNAAEKVLRVKLDSAKDKDLIKESIKNI